MTPAIGLAAAMSDPQLVGGAFQQDSFWSWLTVAKLLDGTPLDEREAALFRQCTGRTQLPDGPVQRLLLLVGRRGGKDRFLSAVAVWRAALCADWREYMSAGETATVLLLGADKKQAQIMRRYCEGLLQAPLLAAEVLRCNDDVIEFRNGASLEINTNDVRLVRGRSAVAVLGSETCYWRVDEASASSDEEVVAAATPSLAMCPDGGLLALGSSVYRKKGYMHRRWQALHGNDGSEDICWLAPSSVMNPKLPSNVVEKALLDDPERAKAEFLSQWRGDLSDFLPADIVAAAIDAGVHERCPVQGRNYFAYADAAGGTGADSFAIAVAHREANGVVVLDALRRRTPRFVPEAVVSEFGTLLASYRVTQLMGDRWGGGFHSDAWRRNGITYNACEQTTSENYLAALPLLLSGRARLLDDPVLQRELTGLERRAHANGRESVSHAAAASAHDDVAAAVCGALVAAAASARSYDMLAWFDNNETLDLARQQQLAFNRYVAMGGYR